MTGQTMNGSDVDELAAKMQALVALHGKEKTDPLRSGLSLAGDRGSPQEDGSHGSRQEH